MVRLSHCVYLVAISAILYCLSCHFNLVVVCSCHKYLCAVILIHPYRQILIEMLMATFQNFTYYALHASHNACIMFQHEQSWCKHFIAWIFYCSIYDTKIIDSIYAFQCMLNALLEHIELFNTIVYFNVHWLFY